MDDISLLFCGDVFIANKNDLQIEEAIKSEIKSADLSLANFEGPETSCQQLNLKAGPSLKQALGSVRFLKSCGFKFLSLANNHIMDYGKKGLIDTIKNVRLN